MRDQKKKKKKKREIAGSVSIQERLFALPAMKKTTWATGSEFVAAERETHHQCSPLPLFL